MLTAKQDRFCTEYVFNAGDASAAYRTAFNTSNMKPETVNRRAHELKNRGKIRARITLLQSQEENRLKLKYQIDNDRVMRELVRLAFSDIGELFDDNGNLISPKHLPEDTRRALTSFDVITSTRGSGENAVVEFTHKFKMADKLAALEKIAKILGMYREDNVQKTPKQKALDVDCNLIERLGRLYPDPLLVDMQSTDGDVIDI